MLDRLEQLKRMALDDLEKVQDQKALTAWKTTHLGKGSSLSEVMEAMKSLPKEEKPAVGKGINQVKSALEAAYDDKAEGLQLAALAQSLEQESVDVTLPGRPIPMGRLHPITQTLRRIYHVFGEMGFQVYLSRDVELDEYNFQLLNFPPHHPARDMQDSYYIDDGRGLDSDEIMLRTHTSPGQIHAMRELAAMSPDDPPPVRIILPGMCYRYEQVSARSEVQFTQVEGLAVGENITFSDLKGTLKDFARRMYGQQVRARFRASYFPFTEPSAEMDIECFICDGAGCSVCKRTGWLEILGCGMVHPVVLENGGYDPARYTGFAFGMGPERITMLSRWIEDIRLLWNSDLRFLDQF
ncbi:MAG: phenylalanine--tRNA ligase subunit alpha [Anaerolineales bacterium]|jgi:phenylalanyl-tRNA synthetase alpha chain